MGDLRGQIKAWDPLELELQEVVSHGIWVLGTQLDSLEEQQALPAAEASLQTLTATFQSILFLLFLYF